MVVLVKASALVWIEEKCAVAWVYEQQHVVTVPTLHAVYDLHDVWRMCMRFIPRGGLFRVQDRKHGAVGMVEVHNGTWQQRSGSTAYEFEGGDHASLQTIAWCIRLNVQPTGHDRARLARVQLKKTPDLCVWSILKLTLQTRPARLLSLFYTLLQTRPARLLSLLYTLL